MDIGLVEGTELELHWHNEDALPGEEAEFEPDEAIAVVNPDLKLTNPFNSTEYSVIPTSQNLTTVYVGFGTEDSSIGAFGTWDTEDDRLDPLQENNWIRLNLVSVDGPGEFSVWDGFINWIDSGDGISSLDAIYVADQSHSHFNIGFSEPGTYNVGFSVTGSVGGNDNEQTSGVSTFTFVVPEPTSLALVAGLGGVALVRRKR